jgi:hypothetical protein
MVGKNQSQFRNSDDAYNKFTFTIPDKYLEKEGYYHCGNLFLRGEVLKEIRVVNVRILIPKCVLKSIGSPRLVGTFEIWKKGFVSGIVL